MQQRRARVLLVDDDPDLRNLVGSLLRRDGLEVIEACDGEDALALCAHGDADDADVIVTDIWMPRCDGLTMIEALRARGVAAPVLVISAHVDGETKARAMRLRARAFLAKPFRATDLRAWVRALVASEAHASEADVVRSANDAAS